MVGAVIHCGGNVQTDGDKQNAGDHGLIWHLLVDPSTAQALGMGLDHLSSWASWGPIRALIANSKGRNASGWFCCGFFISFIGLIIIIALNTLNTEQAVMNAQLEMNRRLRDQGLPTRQKVEQITNHSLHRLDQYDLGLGIPAAMLLLWTRGRPGSCRLPSSRLQEILRLRRLPPSGAGTTGATPRLGPMTIHDPMLSAKWPAAA